MLDEAAVLRGSWDASGRWVTPPVLRGACMATEEHPCRGAMPCRAELGCGSTTAPEEAKGWCVDHRRVESIGRLGNEHAVRADSNLDFQHKFLHFWTWTAATCTMNINLHFMGLPCQSLSSPMRSACERSHQE